MNVKHWTRIALCLAVVSLLATSAEASRENPASCLLFPYYDTSGDSMSIHTITNVGDTQEVIRIVFIDGENCTPFDMWYTLTPGDTFTFGAHGLLPPQETGFMYVYVVESLHSNLEKDADVLIGQEIILGVWDHRLINFSINAVGFQAKKMDLDGKVRLDGVEYSCAPKTVYFPRFFGQDSAIYSRMILINLTGGRYFDVNAYIKIYNDNEELFTDSIVFDCFDNIKLLDFSPATDKNFLLSSNHSANEPWPFYSLAETGTIRITGEEANSTAGPYTIDHASIYAVLIEGFGTLGFTGGDLPMQIEDPDNYNNAMLWSVNPDGS